MEHIEDCGDFCQTLCSRRIQMTEHQSDSRLSRLSIIANEDHLPRKAAQLLLISLFHWRNDQLSPNNLNILYCFRESYQIRLWCKTNINYLLKINIIIGQSASIVWNLLFFEKEVKLYPLHQVSPVQDRLHLELEVLKWHQFSITCQLLVIYLPWFCND